MKSAHIVLLPLMILVSYCSNGQTLQEKYDEMIESTETYNQYKLIPRTRIDAFWTETTDSLYQKRNELRVLSEQVKLATDSTESLRAKMNEMAASLEKSLVERDSFSFIGLVMSKTTYHIMVWGIILGFLVAGIILYISFSKGNRVTVAAKKELETLQFAYEEHKNQARENQVKLKRELQTAINSMEEMKRGR